MSISLLFALQTGLLLADEPSIHFGPTKLRQNRFKTIHCFVRGPLVRSLSPRGIGFMPESETEWWNWYVDFGDEKAILVFPRFVQVFDRWDSQKGTRLTAEGFKESVKEVNANIDRLMAMRDKG